MPQEFVKSEQVRAILAGDSSVQKNQFLSRSSKFKKDVAFSLVACLVGLLAGMATYWLTGWLYVAVFVVASMSAIAGWLIEWISTLGRRSDKDE